MDVSDDADAIHDVGHRRFVGGNDEYWSKISSLQFEFLVSEGLKPSDFFVDVACGSLRGGIRLIPYLDRGHYTGIDKHIELIIYGIASELGESAYREKRPRFIIDDQFDFSKLRTMVNFGLAQSLFTHLTREHISLCLHRLRSRAAAGCRFFATFFEAEIDTPNPEASHSHGIFRFTRQDMEQVGREAGWTPLYVGPWGHPRGQHMMEYRVQT